MHCNSELKRFTYRGCFHASAYAAPECRVKQHDVNRSVQNIRRELLEVDDNGIRRERHSHLLTYSSHAVHAKHRIFEIIVANVFNLLPKPDRRFRGPYAIWIKTKMIARQRCGQSTITFQFIFRRKNSALQFVGSETVK